MDYKNPESLDDLNKTFDTEKRCSRLLSDLRWQGGFVCPHCQDRKAWLTHRRTYHCSTCNTQTSVTAGTMIHGTRKPLALWLQALWHIAEARHGTSALKIKEILGLGSYRTAWQWMHRFRRAIKAHGQLTGCIEVNQDTLHKDLHYFVAVEVFGGNTQGKVWMAPVSAEPIGAFIQRAVKPGSQIRSSSIIGEELPGYTVEQDQDTPVAGQLAEVVKAFVRHIYRGAVQQSHFEYYLDEFTFRLNHRTLTTWELFSLLAQRIVRGG